MSESIITLGIGATSDLDWFITSGLHCVSVVVISAYSTGSISKPNRVGTLRKPDRVGTANKPGAVGTIRIDRSG